MADLVLRDGQPEQILLVGDSRIRMFDGLIFTDRARGIEVLTRARWRAFFRSTTFFGEDGRFDADMTRLWWELRCAKHARDAGSPIFTPFRYRRFGASVDEVGVEPCGQDEHTIVVSGAGVDAWDIEEELASYEIVLDEPVEGVDRLPGYLPVGTIDERALRAIISARIAPLFNGMAALRDAGFSKLFMLGHAPPSTEDRPDWKPVRQRYVVRRLFDRVFAERAREIGVAFVPVWDDLATGGLRDDRYFLDAEHVNHLGATVLLSRVYAVQEASLPI